MLEKETVYSHFLNAIVFCRWIDITTYEVNNIDDFLKYTKDVYHRHSIIFITTGKLIAEDDKVVVLTSTLAEKNPNVEERPAQEVRNIPKNCILDMRELEFKGEKPIKVVEK